VPESKSQAASHFYGLTLSQVFTACSLLITTKGEEVFLLFSVCLF